MFAMTLSALLLGIAADPSVADAPVAKPELVDRMCSRMGCTRDQLAKIHEIVANTRVKIAAERADDRQVLADLKLARKGGIDRAEHLKVKAALDLERMEMDRIVWSGINAIGDVLDREQAAMFDRFVDDRNPMVVFHVRGDHDGKRAKADGKHHGKRGRDGKLAKGERGRAKVDGKAAKGERKRAAELAKAERKAGKGERRIDRRAAARDFTVRHPAKA